MRMSESVFSEYQDSGVKAEVYDSFYERLSICDDCSSEPRMDAVWSRYCSFPSRVCRQGNLEVKCHLV